MKGIHSQAIVILRLQLYGTMPAVGETRYSLHHGSIGLYRFAQHLLTVAPRWGTMDRIEPTQRNANDLIPCTGSQKAQKSTDE